MKEEHTFGWIVLVLDDTLQNRKNLNMPPPMRISMHVVKSSFYASSISLMLNSKTGLISPQCHCGFEDTFSALESIRREIEPPNWNTLAMWYACICTPLDFIKTLSWNIKNVPKDSTTTTPLLCFCMPSTPTTMPSLKTSASQLVRESFETPSS